MIWRRTTPNYAEEILGLVGDQAYCLVSIIARSSTADHPIPLDPLEADIVCVH